jgi:rhamnosyltransferase subunit B
VISSSTAQDMQTHEMEMCAPAAHDRRPYLAAPGTASIARPSLEDIVICTLGTRGDVLPFLAIARQFINAGHSVTILTNENWRGLVEHEGAHFHAIADEDEPQDERDDAEFFYSNIYPSFRRSFDFLAAKAREKPNYVLIHRTNMLGADCCAEVFGLTNIKVALQPTAILSRKRPPWPLTGLAFGPLAPVCKALLPLVYRLGTVSGPYRRLSNDFRRSVGVPHLPFWRLPPTGAPLLLMMCPDWFAMPQTDWPPECRLMGFPFQDAAEPDEDIERFIAANGPPLVFTPGTGIRNARHFFSRAVAICARTGLPGIVLGKDLHDLHPSAPVIARSYADLGWLLPRAKMLVHHGGIGSVAQAIRAGIPQLVMPERLDQPDNAVRVATLGLGGAIFSKATSVTRIAALIHEICNNAEVRSQTRIAAELVGQGDAARNAYNNIRSVMQQRLPAAGQP